MQFTKQESDKLALELACLRFVLDELTPEQKRRLDRHLAARVNVPHETFTLTRSEEEEEDGMHAQQSYTLAMTLEEMFERLQQTASDGKIEWSIVGRFASQPAQTLKLIPFDVRRDYGLPDALPDAHEKSHAAADAGLTRGDVLRRLERAVHRGVCDAQTLGLFAKNANQALGLLSDEVRKSYGLPERLTPEPLRKSYTSSEELSTGEVFTRIGDAIRGRDLDAVYRSMFLKQGRAMLASIPATVRTQYGLPSQ